MMNEENETVGDTRKDMTDESGEVRWSQHDLEWELREGSKQSSGTHAHRYDQQLCEKEKKQWKEKFSQHGLIVIVGKKRSKQTLGRPNKRWVDE
jgi:hypothetical protein